MKLDCGCHSHNGFRVKQRSPEGLVQREFDLPGVDGRSSSKYLDKVGSVSGLELERDLFVDVSEALMEEQYRRFANGS